MFFNDLIKSVVHFPGEMFNFDGFHNVSGGPGNSPPDPADPPDLVKSAGNGVRTPRTDPGFPAPGVRMTVVTTNSLKLSFFYLNG